MKELVLKKLEELGEDVMVEVRDDEIEVIVNDFEGFDDHWCEVLRDFDEDAVGEFVDWLEEQCLEHCGDYYHYYKFDGFTVEIGYASFDI